MTAGAITPVFELNAQYFADPAAQPDDLNADAGCMHQALEETLQALLSRIDDGVEDKQFARQLIGLLFGAIYLARLAAGMSEAAARPHLRARPDTP